MSKRHIENTVNIVRCIRETEERRRIAKLMAMALLEENSDFNEKTFLMACGFSD